MGLRMSYASQPVRMPLSICVGLDHSRNGFILRDILDWGVLFAMFSSLPALFIFPFCSFSMQFLSRRRFRSLPLDIVKDQGEARILQVDSGER